MPHGVKQRNELAQTPSANLSTVAGMLTSKNMENQKAQRQKQFDEFRRLLDKMKVEFMQVYNGGPNKKFTVSIDDFEMLTVLGQGAFGCVILVKHKANSSYYAMKVMNKSRILKDKQFDHTLNEKQILSACNFPFLVRMEFHFKDNCNVFFVLPFYAGGDLFSLLRKTRFFKEKDAKFYAAQVVMALEYLHFMDIVYRDLKPENIVIDVTGYIKIIDFGFCKLVQLRTYTLCGTPEYLAPEIILSKGYGKSVDWWSFGVLLYEMISGCTPFYAEEAMKIYEKITIGKFKFTPDFSAEARELIKNILQIDLSKRYGNLKDGVYDIKGHEWFKMIDWAAIFNRKAVPPFIPKVESPGDTANFDHYHAPKIQESKTEKYVKEFEDF